MKKLLGILLALAMLFAAAGAEEVFVEESFQDAGFQDETFFSEESFFGDAFVAETPAEGEETAEEAENRSVYLFETEARPTDDKLAPWQKYYIKLDAVPSGKKINLTWSLYTDMDYKTPAPVAKVGKGDTAGVKFYVYQVDPWSGIAKEIKAITAQKAAVTAKKPGEYIFFVRMEKVDKKKGSEDLGNASNRAAVTVEATAKDYAISKLKLYPDFDDYYTERDYFTDEVTLIGKFDPYVYVYTKKADASYIVTAQTQGGDKYTGVYRLSDEEAENVFFDGYFMMYLDSVTWNGNMPSPEFTTKGKKLTVTVAPATTQKAKKATAKLTIPKWGKITAKTPPIIHYVYQIDATTVGIYWQDYAAYYNMITPTAYTITCGKTKIEVPVAQLVGEDGKAEYYYKMKVPAVKKPTKMKITVQAKAAGKVKPAKSKAVTLNFLPASGLGIYDEYFSSGSSNVYVSWSGIGIDTTAGAYYEVYLTDSKHTTDIAKTKIMAVKDEALNPNYNAKYDYYYVYFDKSDYTALTDGNRLGVVIKAMAADGVTVLARKAVEDGDKNYNRLQTASIRQSAEEAEYTGDYQSPIQLYNEKGVSQGTKDLTVSKIVRDGTEITPPTYPNSVKDVGTYKITVGVTGTGDSDWCKPIPEKEYTFTIKKRTLDISLLDREYTLTENSGKDYLQIDSSFISNYVNIKNGNGVGMTDLFSSLAFEVQKEDGTKVADNRITESGTYKLVVTVTADPANTDGLTPATDPKPNTKTVTLPLVVGDKKLYIRVYGSHINYGIVGNYPKPNIRVTNWRGSTYFSDPQPEMTVTVKDEKGNVIKEGDVVKKAGVYTYEITATKEGWIDADPVTFKVTIYEDDNSMSVDYPYPSYGYLEIGYDKDPQYKEYNGKAQLPDFKIVDQKGREVTAGYGVYIENAKGEQVDSAVDPGYYEVYVWPDEPFYGYEDHHFDFYITKPWTLTLDTPTLQETGSDLRSSIKFKAKAGDTVIPEYDGSDTQPLYIDYDGGPYNLKKDGKTAYSMTEPGTYTFTLNAWIYDRSSDSWNLYAPVEGKEFTVVVNGIWTPSMSPTLSLPAGTDPSISKDDLKKEFSATSANETIPQYDSSASPAQTSYFNIDTLKINKKGETTSLDSITAAGEYVVVVNVYYREGDKTYWRTNVEFPLSVNPAETTAP